MGLLVEVAANIAVSAESIVVVDGIFITLPQLTLA